VTGDAVSAPRVLIDAKEEFSLQAGVTAVVVLSLQTAVAVYVALPLSLNEAGPEIHRPASVGTTHGNGEARPDSSPVLSVAVAVR